MVEVTVWVWAKRVWWFLHFKTVTFQVICCFGGQFCSMWISALVFSSVKDKVGFFFMPFPGCLCSCSTQKLCSFSQVFSYISNSLQMGLVISYLCLWLLGRWCVTWLIPNFPCLPLAPHRCSEAAAPEVPQSCALTSSSTFPKFDRLDKGFYKICSYFPLPAGR